MDVLDVLRIFNKKKKQRPLPPIRTVQEPGAARRERLEREQADVVTAPVEPERQRRDPFDTGSLEIAREPCDGDNPYDTQSWQVSSPQAPRRVDDLKAINRKRRSGQKDNPYDTVVKKKGW